ncbi:MAG TPA: hypothetical protein VGG56_10085 [Terracidiphilus sp.]
MPAIGLAQAVTFSAAPNPVPAGQTITFTGTTTLSVTAANAKVTLWFYTSGGSYVGSASQTGINFVSGQPYALNISYATSSGLAAGTYTYNLSYYNSAGTGLSGATGQTDDGSFTVASSGSTSYAITATPQPVNPGETMSFITSLNPGVTATDATVKLWFYNSGGTYEGVAVANGVNFTSGQPTAVTLTYPVPSGWASGTYTYNLSYYNSAGAGLATGKTDAGSFTLTSGSASTACATAVVVGLNWPTVASATSYTVLQNGTSLGSTSLLTYTDQTVVPSMPYIYSVEAFDGATKLSTKTLTATTAAATLTGDPAYCPSTSISSIAPNWSDGIFQGNGSDLWSQTLGSDGNQYGFFGDGGGFGGSNSPYSSFGIGAVTSTTGGSLSGAVNVYGGLDGEHSASKSGKATGILEIGPSNSMDFYALAGISNETSSQTKGGANDQEIVYSTGNAWSWTDNASSWTFCTNGGTATNFCPTIFLQNGSGYSGNTDGYVYLYGGTEGSFFGTPPAGTPSYTYLWRVSTAQASILSDTAYEALTGFNADGTPIWTSAGFSTLNSEMVPVFTDRGPRPLGLSAVTYNSGVGRYIASVEGSINQVAFYDAPNPWGPWTSIGYYNSNPNDNSGGWGNLGEGISLTGWGEGSHGDGLGINFVNKWTSTNGETMWVVFSSDGDASTSASLTALQGQDMDGFSAVPLTLTLP